MENKSKTFFSYVNPFPITSFGATIFAILFLLLTGFTIKILLDGDTTFAGFLKIPIILSGFCFIMCFAKIKTNETGISYTSVFKRVKYKWTDIQKTGALHYSNRRVGRNTSQLLVQLLTYDEVYSGEFNSWLYLSNNANKIITSKENLNSKSDFMFFKYNKNALEIIEYNLMANDMSLNWGQ